MLRYFSGYRFANWLTLHVLTGWASRGRVVSFLVLDFFTSLALCLYYVKFEWVPLLGWRDGPEILWQSFQPIHRVSTVYLVVILAGFKVLCEFWGIVSCWTRSTRQVKLFYGIFLINTGVLIWASIPIFAIQCTCDNYLQCKVLQNFAMDGVDLNPLAEPHDQPDRKVRYKTAPKARRLVQDKMPSETQLASPGHDKAEDKTAQQPVIELPPPNAAQANVPPAAVPIAPVTMNALQAQDDLPPRPRTAPTPPLPQHGASSQHPEAQDDFPPRPRTAPTSPLPQQAEQQLSGEAVDALAHAHPDGIPLPGMVRPDFFGEGHPRLVSKRRNRLISEDSPQRLAAGEPSSLLQARADDALGGAAKSGRRQEMEILPYFKAVSGLDVSGESEDCTLPEGLKKERPIVQLNVLKQQASDLESGLQPQGIDVNLKKVLALCLMEKNCGAVRWKVEVVGGENGAPETSVTACTLQKQIEEVPSKTEEVQTEAGTGSASPQGFSLVLKVDEEKAEDLRTDEASLEQLWDLASAQLEPAQGMQMVKRVQEAGCRCDAEDSCRAYDENGITKSWCYVPDESVSKCRAAGYPVYKRGNNKYWTEKLCENAGCRCSRIGMAPAANIQTSAPSEYGSSCSRWNGEADLWDWCYVGFDSLCVDRERPQRNPDWPAELNSQFISHVVCKDGQAEREKRASELCYNLAWLGRVVCIADTVCSILLVFILFNFIRNRCGDELPTETQYVIDSASSCDEFEAQAEQQSRRGSLADRDEEPVATKTSGILKHSETVDTTLDD